MNRASRGNSVQSCLAAAAMVLTWAAAAPAEPVLELVQKIDLKGKPGNLDHLALDARRERLFLANTANNTLDVVDLKAGKLLKQVAGQFGIQGVSYAPDLDRIFVGLGKGGFCNVFNADNYKAVKTVKFGDDADNVRYHAPTHLTYVAHAEKQLGVLDAQRNEKKGEIDLSGDAEGFEIETGRPRLYVNVPSASQVAVVDTDKNQVTGTYTVKDADNSNVPLALDEANHRLFVACQKKPKVVILNSETGAEVGSVPIAGDADDLFFDAKNKRLYASCGEGAVAVVRQMDPDHYEALDKIETVKGAKTSLLDAEGGRFFLAVPRQAAKAGPEIWVYRVKP
jgi:DNA-binding beta-propeller fold protein YncE